LSEGSRCSQAMVSLNEAPAPPGTFGPLENSGGTIEITPTDIENPLGNGAEGIVYPCWDGTGRMLAVKATDLKKKNALLDPQFLKRRHNKAHKEIVILKQLHHTNCLGIVDIYWDVRWVMLVMERAAGGDLLGVVSRKMFTNCHGENAALTEFESSYISAQLFAALSYLHSLGIMHRDVKLENIFDTRTIVARWPDQEELIDIKLGDYGLSKLMEGEVTNTKLGTPMYYAPELIQCSKYTFSVDIWAAGVTLHTMLHGEYTFDENDIYRTAFAINRSLSDDLRDFLCGLLKADPAERLPIAKCLAHPWTLLGR